MISSSGFINNELRLKTTQFWKFTSEFMVSWLKHQHWVCVMRNIIDSSFNLNLTFVISAISPWAVSVHLHVLSISAGLWPEETGRITLFYIQKICITNIIIVLKISIMNTMNFILQFGASMSYCTKYLKGRNSWKNLYQLLKM